MASTASTISVFSAPVRKGRSAAAARSSRRIEAPELVVVQAERRVGVGLDADGREAAVPGQQEVPVQGILESELVPDARELFRRARPIREQVSDDELVPLAAGVSGVDEARHVLELGDLVLDLLVQVAQRCEEREVEDLRRLDGDEDAVVSPELLAKGVVGDADGVVLVQKALGRGVDLDPRELRDQRAGDEQDGGDREPRVAVGPVAPAREGVLDPLPGSVSADRRPRSRRPIPHVSSPVRGAKRRDPRPRDRDPGMTGADFGSRFPWGIDRPRGINGSDCSRRHGIPLGLCLDPDVLRASTITLLPRMRRPDRHALWVFRRDTRSRRSAHARPRLPRALRMRASRTPASWAWGPSSAHSSTAPSRLRTQPLVWS